MYIDWELCFKIAALVISLAVFIKGIYEYTKAQRWKKAEFVSKEIKEFFNDFEIKRALVLLDWNSNDLELKPSEMAGRSKIHFTDNLIESALHTHKQVPTFTDEEVIIKAIFDTFFERLTMFYNYIETKLIEAKDIKPYLIYWINILADDNNDRKPQNVRKQIWIYIEEYGYSRIRSFCDRLRNAN